jgi:hypothetical protein
VFAFMHPSLPGEPLVVLHTAIMDHIPANMDAVLTQQHGSQGRGSNSGSAGGGTNSGGSGGDGGDCRNSGSSGGGSNSGSSSEASVACFYSISSGQRGLAGVDLGNFLIKKAAQLLLAELPQLKTLVTLSPIPGFRAWLITKLRQAAAAVPGADSNAGVVQLLSVRDVAAVLDMQSTCLQAANRSSSSSSSSCAGGDTQAAAAQVLLQLMQDNSWVSLQAQQQETLRPVLLRLCAAYLLTERRRNFALDPVAHFHLRNGAQLWRINWRWAQGNCAGCSTTGTLHLTPVCSAAVIGWCNNWVCHALGNGLSQVSCNLAACAQLASASTGSLHGLQACESVTALRAAAAATAIVAAYRADLSAQGLSNSCGLMVNYLYDMDHVVANNQRYLLEHNIAASQAVKELLSST